MVFRCGVRNIAWTVGKGQLKEYFSRFGEVKDCSVHFDLATGLSKRRGYVIFSNRKAFDEARELGETGTLFLEGNSMHIYPQTKFQD